LGDSQLLRREYDLLRQFPRQGAGAPEAAGVGGASIMEDNIPIYIDLSRSAAGALDEEHVKLLELMHLHDQEMKKVYYMDMWVRRPFREIREYVRNAYLMGFVGPHRSLVRRMTVGERLMFSHFLPAASIGDIPRTNPHPLPPLPERDVEVISGLNVQLTEDKIVVSIGKIKVRDRIIDVEGQVFEKPHPPFKVVVNCDGNIFIASQAAGAVAVLLEVER
jgi:hypothetical protein